MRSSAAARRRSADTLRAARTTPAATRSSPTTVAAIGIARSARARPRASGSPHARPSCCPSSYFHVVYTLPAELRDIAYQNKRVIYDLLMKAAAETTLHDRRRSQASRRPHRHHRGAAHVGLGDDASSARAHDRAGRRTVGRWQQVDRIASRTSSCTSTCSAPVPRQAAGAAHRGARRRPPAVLRHASRRSPTRKHSSGSWRRCAGSSGSSTARSRSRGPEQVLRYLSRYTHRVAISNRRLVAADDGGVVVPLEGLPHRRPRTLEDDDARRRTSSSGASCMHVLPKGFHRIRHYGLFANGNRTESIARARELLAVAPPPPKPEPSQRRRRRAARAADTVPVLRRTHARHRGVRARLRAEASADTDAAVIRIDTS